MMTDKRVMIELTTKCNFDCDYCYSKQYDDKMMSVDLFKSIVDEWKSSSTPLTFVLAGEGEAMLHPSFWDMVEYAHHPRHYLTMITNGSALNQQNVSRMKKLFDKVAVSLDTMDASLADRVGRHHHDKVIAGIRLLAHSKIPVMVMTTDFGQDIEPVRQFIKTLPPRLVEHRVQPLYTKQDYATSYTMFAPIIPVIPKSPTRVRCDIASNGAFIAYDVNGIKTPCCHIKDKTSYIGYDALVEMFSRPDNKEIPTTCIGCRMLSITA